MSYDPEKDGPLRSGAMNDGDAYDGGISPQYARALANKVEEDYRKHGDAHEDDGGITKPGPRRNLESLPDGYGRRGGLL